jgi:single-strand DNA-binding protein
MPSFATCTLIGNLGRDPETRATTGDGSVTTLSLGVTRTGTGRDGAKTEQTTWWRVTIWGTRGKTAAQHLRKGSCAIITGFPQVREYTDADGVKRSQAEVLNADWAFGESRASAQSAQSQSTAAPAASAASAATAPVAPTTPRPAAGGDDEPPF